jgi:hypothetical protein
MKPILFSGPLVRAILDGRKTVTRRPVKLREFGPSTTRGYDWTFRDRRMRWNDVSSEKLLDWSPCGKTGDRLWVREKWASAFSHGCWGTLFAADMAFVPSNRQHVHGPIANANDPPPHITWRPSIHMPRWASRITLRVTDVRVEHLQDITDDDAQREGVTPLDMIGKDQRIFGDELHRTNGSDPHVLSFVVTWDTIYDDRHSLMWASNPWVWRVEFEVSS